MRLLVTGARGQVGWELARGLMPLGEVFALERSGCDLARPETLEQVVEALAPDVIVNAAAYTAVDRAESEEQLAMTVNAVAVGELARLARRCNALMVHFSTDYVFDGSKDGAYLESDPTCPINAYGRSKLAGERALLESGADGLVLRTSWVYAARGGNFLRTMLRLGREREQLAVVADQFGAPTWARNIADATAHVVARAQRERAECGFESAVLNLAASGSTSWHGFAQAIFARAASAGVELKVSRVDPIPSAAYPVPARRPANSRLSGAAIEARYGLAMPDWGTALTRCIEDLLWK
jgi:dTDP-4-dehydrorhamnose reductase